MTPPGLVWYLGNRQPIDLPKATVPEARSSGLSATCMHKVVQFLIKLREQR